ncbi:MAG TPA: ATP-binding cassette domain-containing protein, partial [Thermomicrobiaceae bacterium]|nr:ATP-binding cassette domain-containing protein [Thermomicrobiaceae bacterium]
MPVTILSVNNLSKSFGVESIFSDISFQVREQERIALVGINGAGKSTLLNIIAGQEPADSGAIDVRDGLRVTYQAQEATFPAEQTVWQAGLAAFAETLRLRDRMSDLERAMASVDGEELDHLFNEYADLSTRFETAGGYDIDHQVATVLDGLGFSEDDRDEPTRNLSGGQRTRLALAQALLSDPDLLLLDEPTNHLDLKALDWIDGFLRSWRRALIVVSHDRYFLDRVTERTLDLSFGTLEDYPGSYSRYVELRAERRARRQFEYEAQQEFINQTEEFIRRYKAGQRSKEARGRE